MGQWGPWVRGGGLCVVVSEVGVRGFALLVLYREGGTGIALCC